MSGDKGAHKRLGGFGDRLKQLLVQHPPDQPFVRLSLTDDLVLRSSNWARWQLGIPLPVD